MQQVKLVFIFAGASLHMVHNSVICITSLFFTNADWSAAAVTNYYLLLFLRITQKPFCKNMSVTHVTIQVIQTLHLKNQWFTINAKGNEGKLVNTRVQCKTDQSSFEWFEQQWFPISFACDRQILGSTFFKVFTTHCGLKKKELLPRLLWYRVIRTASGGYRGTGRMWTRTWGPVCLPSASCRPPRSGADSRPAPWNGKAWRLRRHEVTNN